MIYGLPAQHFVDITDGSSSGSPAYSAGVGYDLMTGRGSPLAPRVVADLVGVTIAPVPAATAQSVIVNGGAAVHGH